MQAFQPRFDGYEAKIRESFRKQKAMDTLGVEILSIAPGRVELAMNFGEHLTQQHGFIHAGITTTALDSACGYAALSLMEEAAAVMSVEFKTCLMAPADGERFLFTGEVVRPGRTITFTSATARAIKNGEQKVIASMTATMIALTARDNVKE